VLQRMPIIISTLETHANTSFLSLPNMKSCNACQNRYLVSKRMPKNVEIKIWSGNACQMMNFDSISQVNPYSNSQSINVAFSPGVISLYAASVGSHTFGRPGGGQKCGPRRRPPMCIHFPQVLGM